MSSSNVTYTVVNEAENLSQQGSESNQYEDANGAIGSVLPDISDMSSSNESSAPDEVPPLPLQPSPTDRPVTFAALDLAGAGQQMFLNPLWADCKVVCENYTFPAHKLVLGGQSEFFCGAFRSGLRESRDNIIVIKEEKPAAVYRMLHFLYHGEYSQLPTDSTGYEDFGTNSCTKVNLNMYKLADKFGIPGLAKKAAEIQKFSLWESRSWVSETKADIHATKHAYRLFPGRYDAMKMVCMASLAITFFRDQLVTITDVLPLCEENPELSRDLQQWSHWELMCFDGEAPTSRPEEWVRNPRGGWDIRYGWGQGPAYDDGRI